MPKKKKTWKSLIIPLFGGGVLFATYFGYVGFNVVKTMQINGVIQSGLGIELFAIILLACTVVMSVGYLVRGIAEYKSMQNDLKGDTTKKASYDKILTRYQGTKYKKYVGRYRKFRIFSVALTTLLMAVPIALSSFYGVSSFLVLAGTLTLICCVNLCRDYLRFKINWIVDGQKSYAEFFQNAYVGQYGKVRRSFDQIYSHTFRQQLSAKLVLKILASIAIIVIAFIAPFIGGGGGTMSPASLWTMIVISISVSLVFIGYAYEETLLQKHHKIYDPTHENPARMGIALGHNPFLRLLLVPFYVFPAIWQPIREIIAFPFKCIVWPILKILSYDKRTLAIVQPRNILAQVLYLLINIILYMIRAVCFVFRIKSPAWAKSYRGMNTEATLFVDWRGQKFKLSSGGRKRKLGRRQRGRRQRPIGHAKEIKIQDNPLHAGDGQVLEFLKKDIDNMTDDEQCMNDLVKLVEHIYQQGDQNDPAWIMSGQQQMTFLKSFSSLRDFQHFIENPVEFYTHRCNQSIRELAELADTQEQPLYQGLQQRIIDNRCQPQDIDWLTAPDAEGSKSVVSHKQQLAQNFLGLESVREGTDLQGYQDFYQPLLQQVLTKHSIKPKETEYQSNPLSKAVKCSEDVQQSRQKSISTSEVKHNKDA